MDNKELSMTLKKSLETIRKIKEKLKRYDQAIAIIGMSCRYPGGANSPEELWALLEKGEHGIIETPKDRWDNERYYDPDPEKPGKMSTRSGAYLQQDIRLFDNHFFGISDEEAREMDPQQRLVLELAWEALENAAIAPESCSKTNTGVYLGASFNDYLHLLQHRQHENPIGKYMTPGNHFSVLTGRLAYHFGFEGPALTIDTACSASLVAIHQACESLRLGDCDMALAGGVNLILAPESTIGAAKAGMLSKDDRCKTFDASADGFVRGEGAGLLVLKRLSDAEKARDRILGIILGSAVNQNGKSASLTAPNGVAQERVMKKALAQARISPHEVGFLEAHGTGTLLGDLIEFGSISQAYGQERLQENPLIIGTLKTNIGHTETASGVAGIIKILLSLKHNLIPKHLNLINLNPSIKLAKIPAKIPIEALPWSREKSPRIAAVSAFGFSGSNAHIIVKEAINPENETRANARERASHILTLSAKTDTALKKQIANLQDFISTSSAPLADMAYTLNTGRNHFSYRTVFITGSIEELKNQIKNNEYKISNNSEEKKLKVIFEYTEKPETLIHDSVSNNQLIEFGQEIDWNSILKIIAEHYMKGANIDWKSLDAAFTRNKLEMPSYPFERTLHWFTDKRI